jgi:hypothetical protein
MGFLRKLLKAPFWERYPPLFVGAFLVCFVLTIQVHYMYPFWPGQDDNYDKYCTMVVARMGSDPAIAAIYQPMQLWHSQTLLYFLGGLLGHVMEPTAAMRTVYVCFAFLGTPLVTAWILTHERRSPWAALLAFPLAYGRMWSFGFLKFSAAAPFFLLTLFTFAAIFRAPRLSYKHVLAYAVAVWLLWTSHTQVFAFAGVLLAVAWMLLFVHRASGWFAVSPPTTSPRVFAAQTLATGAASMPVLAAFYGWYKETQSRLGGLSEGATWKDGLWGTLDEKFRAMLLLVQVTKLTDEQYQTVLLIGLAFFLVCLRKLGSRDRSFLPEVFFALTAMSYFLLPREIGAGAGGQLVAPRHIDIALWLLPLCVAPPLFARHKLASIAGVGLIARFTALRLAYLFGALRALNTEDMKGLEQLVSQAPEGHLRITQVTFGEQSSKEWFAFTFEQNYAYLAARKGYEAPVYDTRVRAMEVRYKDGPPSPPTIMVNDTMWWKRPDVLQNFDLVLTFRFHPTSDMRMRMDPVVHSVGHSGEWELWQKR